MERLCHLWTWRSLELFASALVESYSIEPAILSTLLNSSCRSFYFYFIFPFRVECLWKYRGSSQNRQAEAASADAASGSRTASDGATVSRATAAGPTGDAAQGDATSGVASATAPKASAQDSG